jgi:hypothetical protein
MLSELGLDPWGVRHGIVTKLDPRPNAQLASEGLVQGTEPYGGDWFDLERSVRLYQDVYMYRGLRDRALWQDRSTANIPLQYYATALMLADAAEVGGLPEDVSQELRADAAEFRLLADGGSAARAGT